MAGTDDALARSLALIEAAPESANALTLYALINTLEYARAGWLFKLAKLKDMDAEARQLVYALMELAVTTGVDTAAWQDAKARMDRAVRGV